MITTAQEAIEDNLVLGQPKPRWKNSDLPSKTAFQSTSKLLQFQSTWSMAVEQFQEKLLPPH